MMVRKNRYDVAVRERITVARLLTWVYRDQKADLMSGKGLLGMEVAVDCDEGGTFRGASSCCATVEMNGLLGTIIRSTGWQQRPALHPDAEAVHDVVMACWGWATASLLIRHARQADTPDWHTGMQRLVALERLGEIVQDRYDEVVTVKYRKSSRVVPVLYCPVVRHPSMEFVEMQRDVYRQWHRGLLRVEERLEAVALVRWQVDGIGAAAEPWRVTFPPHPERK